MNQEQVKKTRQKAYQLINKAHITLTEQERTHMEVADCGFDDIENLGLQAVTYINTDRYCAKEIILLPGQLFPEHQHPPIDESNPGKQETFRCRWGQVLLYVEGKPSDSPKAKVPSQYRPYLTVWKEVELRPGNQYTLPPNTKHWFQAGEKGAVLSEFSSTSIDEKDEFSDPRVKRIPLLK
ncbi:MAG: D-lyxose/D-mannose family sugar isomerase [Candidatus Aminicenantes bacterium]|nr:D-lyxose/D-mannose family sugar isomerase [Candidatus Aminicenantes bacterium]